MLTQNRTMSHKVYECKSCNYNTGRKNDYNKHLLTRKHIMLSNADNNADIKKEIMNAFYAIVGTHIDIDNHFIVIKKIVKKSQLIMNFIQQMTKLPIKTN